MIYLRSALYILFLLITLIPWALVAVVFSAFQRGAPDVYPVADLVPGFSEALMAMKPGDRWLVYIPSTLGYGDRGYPGLIGPGENLLFEILLVSAAG